VFQLLYDSRHNVLMTRLYGRYVEDDITVRDNAVTRFVHKHGLARGIMDFTDVESVHIPMEFFVKRAHDPPRLPGQARVMVAPHDITYGLNRVIAAHQLFTRNVEPLVVRTLAEGYQALQLDDPKFEPLQDDGIVLLDSTMARVLASIDEGQVHEHDADADRLALRDKMLRLLDTVLMRPPAQPLHAPNVITLSDILNVSLSRARLSDADLRTTCGQCRHPLSLNACRITAGRQTTYTCPNCRNPLVVLAPIPLGAPPSPEDGYLLGSFLVRTVVDIECRGVRLPKTLDRSTRSDLGPWTADRSA
jgi:hypothetical protein